MSTRMFTMLTAAAALAVAGGITTAGVALAAPPPEPALPGSPAAPSAAPAQSAADAAANSAAEAAADAAANGAAPSVSPKAASGKEAASPAECRDADCYIEIRDGMEIPLNGEHGVRKLKIKVEGTKVTFIARTKTAKAVAVTDASIPFSYTHINGLTLRPSVAEDGRLMLTISHE
ncbi:hypothetical protein [Actinomadura sp. 7K534]|uniref:hypothetical protein n=1 Tax=Actinomadura sp. 7K534 TaxID=2530366 RepID=UPI0014048E38|nr:hypothetical protein [Actinomadura sp. 7K534]